MAGKGAGKPHLQTQGLGQISGPVADIPHKLRQIPVLEGERRVLRKGGGGEKVYQPQQPVIALVHNGGFAVQLRVLIPGFRRDRLYGRQMKGAEGPPDLGGDSGKQGLRLYLT